MLLGVLFVTVTILYHTTETFKVELSGDASTVGFVVDKWSRVYFR